MSSEMNENKILSNDLSKLMMDVADITQEAKNLHTINAQLNVDKCCLAKEIDSYKKRMSVDAQSYSKYATICKDLERANNILSSNKAIKDKLKSLTELNGSLSAQLKKAADKINAVQKEHELNLDKMMKKLRDENDCLKTKIELVQSENNIKIDRLQEKNLKQSTEQQLKFNAMVCHYEEMLQKSTNEKPPRTAEMKTNSANEKNKIRSNPTVNVTIQNTCAGIYNPVAYVVKTTGAVANSVPNDRPPTKRKLYNPRIYD